MQKIDRNQINFLFLDTELALTTYYAYGSRKPQYLPASRIRDRKFMPCAAWGWRHETSIYSAATIDDEKQFKKNYRNDYIVAKKLFDVMEQADVIIGHNFDGFDMKEINRIFSLHGVGVLPDIRTIDTLKVARKYFAFEGNSLRDLADLFGIEQKLDAPDWIAVVEGDRKETEYAVKYCKRDVKVLKKVFERLVPFIKNLPKVPRKHMPENCDACGSGLLKNHGTRFDGRSYYIDIRCLECKHPHRAVVRAK